MKIVERIIQALLLQHLMAIFAQATLRSFHRKINPMKTRCKSRFQLDMKRDFSPPIKNDIKDDENGIAYTIQLPKQAGVNWGSDLSFRFVYVNSLDPIPGGAYDAGVRVGDYIIAFGNISTIGKDFDFVLNTLSKQPSLLNYTFFRGTREQMIGGPVPDPREEIFNVRVLQAGKQDIVVPCQGGSTLRNTLLSNGINVYRSLTRFTNCNGKQRCGTCIVEVTEGADFCSRKALDEEMTLRENPESYRLSCVTQVYGDMTVIVQGPVGAAQWTR